MPRSLDPKSKLTLVLACDVDKNPQPKIFAKTPTLNEQRKLVTLLQSLGGGDIAASMDALLDAAAMCLTGWENIPVEFSRETIGDVLTLDELVEVFTFLAASTSATADDKKKSELQPSCDVVNSVSPASVVVATL
jgi:hypothetical protein